MLVGRTTRHRFGGQHPGIYQALEPVCEDVARNAQIALQIAKAVQAIHHIAHDQQRPAVSHHAGSAAHGAGVIDSSNSHQHQTPIWLHSKTNPRMLRLVLI